MSSIRMRRRKSAINRGGRNRREVKFNGKTNRRNKHYVGIFQITCSLVRVSLFLFFQFLRPTLSHTDIIAILLAVTSVVQLTSWQVKPISLFSCFRNIMLFAYQIYTGRFCQYLPVGKDNNTNIYSKLGRTKMKLLFSKKRI